MSLSPNDIEKLQSKLKTLKINNNIDLRNMSKALDDIFNQNLFKNVSRNRESKQNSAKIGIPSEPLIDGIPKSAQINIKKFSQIGKDSEKNKSSQIIKFESSSKIAKDVNKIQSKRIIDQIKKTYKFNKIMLSIQNGRRIKNINESYLNDYIRKQRKTISNKDLFLKKKKNRKIKRKIKAKKYRERKSAKNKF
ncbi:hypothetical protein MHBO_001821 [Bonamia ostreae]|uniref:Uncharacterized protein n=1 Tax=Bonamia ostreae TaxID=126728 RepID=A0ABV2AKA4_9EUKA